MARRKNRTKRRDVDDAAKTRESASTKRTRCHPPVKDDSLTHCSTTCGAWDVALWELPDAIIYEIAQYCVPSTQSASFLCHKMARLCKASHRMILDETKSAGLWNSVLKGDYGVSNGSDNHGSRRRRSCKRLRRSPLDQARDAHKLMKDNTEIAYYYLWEMSSSNTTSKASKNSLTRMNLVKILNTYGPQLMFNKTMSSGGTFLVEVCRCRNAKSTTTILHCVQELVERRGAMINKSTNESSNSTLTPLCVAAVRGMPKVVEYLLSKGALTTIQCSGRFRLHTNPKRSIRCNSVTPLEFAEAMLKAELEEGAKSTDLRDLNSCIKLLQEAECANPPDFGGLSKLQM
jgi:hypothetical protein